jgi:hypothetical protein
MLRISESVEGASVARGDAEQGAGRDELVSALVEKAARTEAMTEGGGADQQELAPAYPVAERAHGDQRARDEEAVDVDDPEELRRGRLEIDAELRDREIEHGEVHRIEQAGQGDHGQPQPVPARRLGRGCRHLGGGRHRRCPCCCPRRSQPPLGLCGLGAL